MSEYRDQAAAERDLAAAAAQRAKQKRRDSAEAAFYDTAVELIRQAEEEERAARVHLEAAQEYERLAQESVVAVTPAGTATASTPAEASGGENSSDRGFALFRRRRDDNDEPTESDAAEEPEGPSAGLPPEDDRIRFFEFSRDMLCTAGFDGYFRLLNDAWERTLGYSKEELLSQPYMHFVHPADVERTTAEAASLGTVGVDTVQFRNRYRAKDGSYRWLEWNSRADMQAELIYAVARDVTDQQRAAEVEGRLSAIMRSSNEAIYGLSPEGSITNWNSAAERLHGYSAAEIVGQPLSKLIPSDRTGEDRRLLERVVAGETVDHFETERLRKDGSVFEASLSISQIVDAHGRIVGASVSARDISDN